MDTMEDNIVKKELIDMMQAILDNDKEWFIDDSNFTDIYYVYDKHRWLAGLLIVYGF